MRARRRHGGDAKKPRRARKRKRKQHIHICSTAPVSDVSRYSLYMLCVPLRELYLIVTP